MELVQDFGDISQSASLAHTVEVMLRRRHRLDQMAKAVDFFKDRVSDEVVRVSRAVRDVKVGLKHIEKSETVKFLKLWKEGKNEHSAKLNFLKNYPESYRNYLNEVSRIRNFNETLKSKIDDIKKIQFEEFNARKSFWETNMRFLPPFLIDLVPAIRRPPLMLVGPGGFPGLDETLPDLCVSKQEDSNIAEVRIADVVEPVLVSDLSSDSRLLVDKSKLAMSAEITIKMLEEQVAEKDRELELLKIKAKDNVRRENELRDLQNLLEPFHLGVLKQYLGIRTVTSTPHSLQSLDESGLVVSGESREVDIPSAESICAKLIKAMEIEEHTSISTMQALLASTSYLKNDLVEDADASSMDTSLLRQIHIQNLEAALEKFSQIIQDQARIIKSNQSMPR